MEYVSCTWLGVAKEIVSELLGRATSITLKPAIFFFRSEMLATVVIGSTRGYLRLA